MDIGVCVASHIGDVDYAVRAEALGYSHAWLADSQMIWSDCHIMRDRGFANFDAPIPLYVSGFGPRSLGLAGRHGDGAIFPLPPHPAVLERFWEHVEAGARDSGRALDRSRYYTTALTTVGVLDPGEPVDSPRMRRECGAFAMATLHYAYDQWRQLGQEPPAFVAPIWDDYRAMLDAVPAERLHQRIHAGHNCWVIEEEERFLTPEVLQASSMIGTRDQLVEQVGHAQ